MSGGSQLPVSALIRQGNQLDDVEGKRRSKDEYRRQKDLEEQRKAGQAPAMVDVETGRDINPHIPEFIEKTPWYVPTAGPTLKHQRPHPEREKRMASITDWFPKGTTNKVAFKYREGACENCGAMGHKKKECFERPRAVGAKFTDEVVAADDYVLPNLKMDYDAKRDRWNGYDPAEYKKVHEEYEQMEEARKLIRAQNMKDGIVEEGAADGGAGDGGGGDETLKNDEDYYAEDMAPAMSVDMDSRTRITVRNLRIREDTAKYLYSLDENSAHYDPKSRSMRENPFENMPGKEKEAAKFSGENFVRYTGEVVDANEAQVFAWQARCQGIDVHALAEPTKLEALKRAYEEKKTEHKGSVTKELLDKYGGQEHLDAPQKELLLAQTENYVEYNRKGKVVKGEERPTVKSRYDEDVFINNHTSVWGSYWRDGQWGFKCCHSLFKNSYCIGEKGLVMEKAMIADGPKVEKSEQSKAPNAADLPSASSTKESTVKEDATMVVDDDEKEPKEKRKKKKGSSRQEHNSASSPSSSESASGGSGSSSEEDNESRDEEEIEREKEKRGKQEKRLETRREKRRRQKERRKNRPKTSSKDKRKAKRREERKLEKEKKRKHHRRDSQSSSSSSSSSSSDSASESGSSSDVEASTAGHKKKSKALSEAIRKIEKQEEEGRKIVEQGDRKRKYNTNYEEVKPSAVETEAYHLTRIHASDPMAALMGEAKKTRKQ